MTDKIREAFDKWRDSYSDSGDSLLLQSYTAGYQAAIASVPQWQPIETAPKDGTTFLGYKHGHVRECFKVQRNDCDMWCFGGTSGDHELFPNIRPTHWMTLPASPSPEHFSKV